MIFRRSIIFSKLVKKAVKRNFSKAEKCGSEQKCSSAFRLFYHEECEAAVNKHITRELDAFYAYSSLANFFKHPLIGLQGFGNMFHFLSKEELEHAWKFMEFQNERGGNVIFYGVNAPPCQEWTAEKAVGKAIEMELDVTKSILEIHKLAAEKQDARLSDFLETEFIQEQYKDLEELQTLLTKIKLAGCNLGVYMVDKELQEEFKNKTSYKYGCFN